MAVNSSKKPTDLERMTDPSPELIKEWIREANHNEPMFAQVAVMGARWGFQQREEEIQELKWRIQQLLNQRG